MRIFAFMTAPWVNIHTHRPTGLCIELRAAGIHPWKVAASGAGGLGRALDELDRELDGAQAVGEIGLDLACGVPLAQQEELFRAQLDCSCFQLRVIGLLIPDLNFSPYLDDRLIFQRFGHGKLLPKQLLVTDDL